MGAMRCETMNVYGLIKILINSNVMSGCWVHGSLPQLSFSNYTKRTVSAREHKYYFMFYYECMLQINPQRSYWQSALPIDTHAQTPCVTRSVFEHGDIVAGTERRHSLH